MTVQIDDILRVAARLTYANNEDDMVNVYHFGVSGGAETDAQTLLNLGVVVENLYIQVNARLSLNVSYEELSVKNLTQDLVLGDTPFPTLANGAGAGDVLPPQSAALVVASTVSPSRQGRKYLGGILEGEQNTGAWGGTMLTSLANYATEYVDTKIQGGITYRPLIVTPPFVGPFPIWILNVGKVITGVRTQRRRTVGRGS